VSEKPERALRITLGAAVAAGRTRPDEAARAEQLGVLGWTRDAEAGGALVHAEGSPAAVEEFLAFLTAGSDDGTEVEVVRPEGHEQFAVRGVPAGRFRVAGPAGGGGYELRLEVAGRWRRWAVPREPSLDPAEKRIAIELEPAPADESAPGTIWDEGSYEQGGRVGWPEALGRGHAVFVLHGERLRGGFALQRTGGGPKPKWLLIKRRDEHARRRPGETGRHVS
jgi:hypothetical protein